MRFFTAYLCGFGSAALFVAAARLDWWNILVGVCIVSYCAHGYRRMAR